tara:strand:- start:14 stop:475 length:462 start_codon:yes stop_codon:yes gene_type:complete
MAKQLSIADIIKKTTEIHHRKDKVEWLKKNDSSVLRNILILTYSKGTKNILLPKTRPPFTPNQSDEIKGALYRESRKLKYFVEGFGYDKMQQIKREAVFIEMLETVHRDDAEVLLNMVQQKPYKGLTVLAITEAFGPIIQETDENTNGEEDQD